VGRSAVIAVAGPDESLDVYWQAAGSTAWHKEQVAGNLAAFSAPSVAP